MPPVPGRSSRAGWHAGIPPKPEAPSLVDPTAPPDVQQRSRDFKTLTDKGLTAGDASGSSSYNVMRQAIEDTLRRLKDTDPELRQILGAIPVDQLMAIRGYAQGDFQPINSSMRGYVPRPDKEGKDPRRLADERLAQLGPAELEQELRPYIEMIKEGLAKLPPTPGKVFRVMSLDPEQDKQQWELYATEGSIIADKAFYSTTSNADIMSAKVFAGPMYLTGNVYLTIEHKTGKRIKELSPYKVEDEVLFAPNTSFKVIGVKQSTNSKGQPRLDVLMQEVGGAA